LNVICDKNNNLFNYIISWISYIIQKPGKKTETELILIGEQGTGKNKFFTDVISKLFGRYAIQNENNINNIIGRFNSNIENKILVICKELQSIDNNKLSNFDGLKSLITDEKMNVESKYLNIRTIDNVSNFIFVSNNSIPIKIANSDRRYGVFKCSDVYKNNFEHF
jgi:phage/plasmid-associated DNA primase